MTQFSSTATRENRATEGERGPVWVVVGLDFEAKIARQHPGIKVHVGVGAAVLTPAFEAALSTAAGVLSFGTAGGLDPTLEPGTVVLASHIQMATVEPERATEPGNRSANQSANRWASEHSAEGAKEALQSLATDPLWLERLQRALPHAHVGGLFSTSQPVVQAAAKAATFAHTGALAVDMESLHLVRLAQRHNIPFAACRVIIDRSTQTLPDAALAGMRDDGTTALAPILLSLLRNPRQLPALLQLGRDASVARQAMMHVAGALPSPFAFAFAN